MDDVQQLGEMLRHYADSEAHKKQLFETQSATWATRINALFGQIQQWLEPVQAPGLTGTLEPADPRVSHVQPP